MKVCKKIYYTRYKSISEIPELEQAGKILSIIRYNIIYHNLNRCGDETWRAEYIGNNLIKLRHVFTSREYKIVFIPAKEERFALRAIEIDRYPNTKFFQALKELRKRLEGT